MSTSPRASALTVRIGVSLIAISCVCFLGIPLSPLLASGARAGAIAGGSFVAAEVTFWVGVALTGHLAWTAARSHGWKKLPGVLWRMFRRGHADDGSEAAPL